MILSLLQIEDIATSLRCPCGRLGCDRAGVREHTDPEWRELTRHLLRLLLDPKRGES